MKAELGCETPIVDLAAETGARAEGAPARGEGRFGQFLAGPSSVFHPPSAWMKGTGWPRRSPAEPPHVAKPLMDGRPV